MLVCGQMLVLIYVYIYIYTHSLRLLDINLAMMRRAKTLYLMLNLLLGFQTTVNEIKLIESNLCKINNA